MLRPPTSTTEPNDTALPQRAAGWVSLSLAACCWPALAADQTVIVTDTPDTDTYRLGDVINDEHSSFSERFELSEQLPIGRSLAAILATAPGTQHRSTGGFGSYSDLRLRGSSAAQVNVFLDGMPLNDASSGSVNFSTLSLMPLQTAEVFRGSAPLQAGSSGLGGVVKLTSQRTGQAAQRSAQIGLGSFGEQALSLLYSDSQARWHYLASVNHHSADNDFTFVNDNATAFNPFDDRKERRHNAEARQDSALFKLSYQATNWRLDQQLQLSRLDTALPDQSNSPDARSHFDTRRALLRSRLSGPIGQSDQWQGALGLYLGHKREHYQDLASRIGLGQQHNRYTTRSAGLELYAEHIGAHNNHTLQLLADTQQYLTADLIDPLPESERQQHKLQGTWQWTHFGPEQRWLVNPQLSLVHHDIQAKSLTEGNAQSDLNAQIGWQYRLTPRWQWRANLASLTRQPSLFERFGDRGFTRGNPALKAETALNSDVGLQFNSPESVLQHASAVVFFSERTDLITTVYDSRGVGTPENINRGQVGGLELSANWQRGPWSLNWRSTWQRPRNKSNISSLDNKDLPNQARWQADLALGYQLGNWQLGYQYHQQREAYYDSLNLLPISEQRVHSLSARYRQHNTLWQLAIDNLGNDNYQDFNGYPTPGRSFNVQLKHTW